MSDMASGICSACGTDLDAQGECPACAAAPAMPSLPSLSIHGSSASTPTLQLEGPTLPPGPQPQHPALIDSHATPPGAPGAPAAAPQAQQPASSSSAARPGHIGSTTSEALVGQMLGGKFEIRRKLGQGGMGAVYLGVQKGLQRPCAIKVLPPNFMTNPELVERFMREAASCAQLDHPHIVRVYDVDHDRTHDLRYLAMELVQGQDLSEVVKHNKRVPWKQALAFTRQAAEGLALAHSKGIVHRDIKPHNLMLTHDRVVKVMDFGLARVASAANNLSQTGQILGTPHFMSPEQARAETCGPPSDVYSLGASLYMMLTGKPPFTAPAPTMLLYKVLEEEPPLVSELDERIPPVVGRLVAKMMAKEIDQRYGSMNQVIADIDRLLGGENPTIAMPKRSQPNPLGIGPKEQLAFGIAAAGVLLVAAMIFWPRGTTPEPEPTPPVASSSAGPTSAEIAALRREAFVREVDRYLDQLKRDNRPFAQRRASSRQFLASNPELPADQTARVLAAIDALRVAHEEAAKAKAAYELVLRSASNERSSVDQRLEAIEAFLEAHPSHAAKELRAIQERLLAGKQAFDSLAAFERRLDTLLPSKHKEADQELVALEKQLTGSHPRARYPAVHDGLRRLRDQIAAARRGDATKPVAVKAFELPDKADTPANWLVLFEARTYRDRDTRGALGMVRDWERGWRPLEGADLRRCELALVACFLEQIRRGDADQAIGAASAIARHPQLGDALSAGPGFLLARSLARRERSTHSSIGKDVEAALGSLHGRLAPEVLIQLGLDPHLYHIVSRDGSDTQGRLLSERAAGLSSGVGADGRRRLRGPHRTDLPGMAVAQGGGSYAAAYSSRDFDSKSRRPPSTDKAARLLRDLKGQDRDGDWAARVNALAFTCYLRALGNSVPPRVLVNTAGVANPALLPGLGRPAPPSGEWSELLEQVLALVPEPSEAPAPLVEEVLLAAVHCRWAGRQAPISEVGLRRLETRLAADPEGERPVGPDRWREDWAKSTLEWLRSDRWPTPPRETAQTTKPRPKPGSGSTTSQPSSSSSSSKPDKPPHPPHGEKPPHPPHGGKKKPPPRRRR